MDRIAAGIESAVPAKNRGKRLGGDRRNMLRLADEAEAVGTD